MMQTEGHILNVWGVCRQGSKALGPGLRYVVWTQGCLKRCPGCISPESQQITPRVIMGISALATDNVKNSRISAITISGGEPFLQAATQGTAFIISLQNHFLLTCSHVVEGKTQFVFSICELKFETPARLLWNNSQCDMALLQVGLLPHEARYLQLCQEETPAGKTTKITLAGYPSGEAVSCNLIVNSEEISNYEASKLNNDRRFDSYMSDINANHGNSGGPIVRQSYYQIIGLLQGGFEQVQVRLITDIRQRYNINDIKQ